MNACEPHPELIIERQLQGWVQAASILERVAAEKGRGLTDETLAREQCRIEIAHRVGPDVLPVFVDPDPAAVNHRYFGIRVHRPDGCGNRTGKIDVVGIQEREDVTMGARE